MDGHVRIPPFAYSGWRLALPGNPPGSQYHGLLGLGEDELGDLGEDLAGSSSADPWNSTWGGVQLQEGEDQSDYVFRSSAEMRPRPNASGGTNVITEFQVRRGGPLERLSQHTIGLMPQFSEDFEIPLPIRLQQLRKPTPVVKGTPIVAHPVTARLPPIKVIGPSPKVHVPSPKVAPPGPKHIVAQPPPPKSPAPAPSVGNRCAAGEYIDAAGNCTSDWTNPYSLYLPKSPAPAPTVAASASDFLPSDGQPLVDSTAAAAGPSWFGQETLIPGVQNGYVAGGAALVLFLMFRGKR